MPIRDVESKNNIRLKELRRALTAPDRDARGPVGIEGPKILEEAIRAGLRVSTVFIAEGSEQLLEALQLEAETEILRLPRALLDTALATETPQPIAALVEPPKWSWPEILAHNPKNALVIVLAGIQDPGNLGTILRSAEAFGATGIISLPGTVSAWNSKAVRASAGSVFRVPMIAASEKECFERLHESRVKVLATAVRGARAVERVDLKGPVALLVGNEGNGVSKQIAAKANAAITIPCPGPVDSLNAAVATSVLLYEVSRQRQNSVVTSSDPPRNSSKGLPHAVIGGRR